jgi:hypothetical protein
MSDLMEHLKPTLDAMNEVYREAYKAGIEEGKRQAYKDILENIKLWEIESCRPL